MEKPSLTTISVSLHLNYDLVKTTGALQLGLVVSKDSSAPSIPAQISRRAGFKRADHLILFLSSQPFPSLAQDKFLLYRCQGVEKCFVDALLASIRLKIFGTYISVLDSFHSLGCKFIHHTSILPKSLALSLVTSVQY